MASKSEARNTRVPSSAAGDSDIQEEGAGTAPPLGSSAGDTLIDHVPYDHLYRALVLHVCQQIELIFGRSFGRLLLAGILEKLPRQSVAETDDTLPIIKRLQAGDITVLEDEWDFFIWDEMANEFNSLFAFARHGEGPRRTPAESRAEIEALLSRFQRLVVHPGLRLALITDWEWMKDTLAAASARWDIDNGRAITADSFAALAGLKSKTIANLIAAGHLPTSVDGRIVAAEALHFLERRRNFVRSTWQDVVPVGPAVERVAALPLPEQVFVPVDADGNAFLPSLARRGRDGRLRYAIGEKSDPEYIEDYWQALDRLARMPTPRWRRPNPSGPGGWGLVSAQDGWRRFARTDLERMITAAQSEQEK